MKRAFYFAVMFLLSAALYCGFGVFCGAVYMAFSAGGAPRVEFASSPALRDFIDASDVPSAEFTARELQDGAAYIMMKAAREKSGASGAVVMPSLFAVEACGGCISVCAPVSLNAFGKELRSGVYLHFSADGKLRLESASVGGAKMPRWAAEILARALEAYYGGYLGGYPERLAAMNVSSEGGKFRFSK